MGGRFGKYGEQKRMKRLRSKGDFRAFHGGKTSQPGTLWTPRFFMLPTVKPENRFFKNPDTLNRLICASPARLNYYYIEKDREKPWMKRHDCTLS
jgi:hypothetical protein